MLYFLGAVAVILTLTMFFTRQMMLGFPSLIFWAIAGGRAYELSTATWDMYYFIFIACTLGMTVFCALAMFALSTKKQEAIEGDELIDEAKDDTQYIDEVKDNQQESRQVKRVRDRASNRRSKGIKVLGRWPK